MARVAHIPYLEKRPSGYFFRRRMPQKWLEISNLNQSSALCLSLRTDVLSEAKILVRCLTALTDLAFALTMERPVDHLNPQSVTLLTELARFQIAAHEAARADAEPRSEQAANFAAQSERATQDMLRRALALGDRGPAIDPLRQVAQLLGVTLDESTSSWRSLAFEALRVMLDISKEKEQREVGQYAEKTVFFRSAMATNRGAQIVESPLTPKAYACVPAAISQSIALPLTPPNGTAAVESSLQSAAPVIATVQPSHATRRDTGALPQSAPIERPTVMVGPVETGGTPAPTNEPNKAQSALNKDRLPLLGNIDLRKLSHASRAALEKPRGITVTQAINLVWELKAAGYADDFNLEQEPDEEAGRSWQSTSQDKFKLALAFWPEFVGDGMFEDVCKDDIRDALAFLPRLPKKHGKGQTDFVASHGYRELIERIDEREASDANRNHKALKLRANITASDREDADRLAHEPRLRTATIVKHRRTMGSVGRILMQLQLIDSDPFQICSVSNKRLKQMQSNEDGRVRTVWDDRLYKLLGSTIFHQPLEDPGEPLFWAPLIARLMGLRAEEVCQLAPSDFGSDNGIHFVDIKRLDGNHVKTGESERRVPVHPQLIELGLLHLVELRKKQGKSRLFSNLTRGKTKGRYSENFSKNFTYYRQTNDCYWPGLDFHAFRTTFHSDLMNQDKSDAIRCRLMGHERTDEGDRSYDQGLGLKTLYDRICDVHIDISKIVSPFGDMHSAKARGEVLNIRTV